MTEGDARGWLADRYPAKAMQRLDAFVELLRAESARQSLIARSTSGEIWSRHILDSAQVASLASSASGPWLDVGSGGGLPGIVIAILRPEPITLCEPRRLRTAFLEHTGERLGLRHATVFTGKADALTGHFAVVTARAVATAEKLFTWTAGVVSRETRYVLPRGESAYTELENLRRTWQGAFHVEQSITHPRSGIIVATGVRPR